MIDQSNYQLSLKMAKNKLRASFSVLSAWESGQWDRAIKMYFRLEKFVTPAMIEGRNFHQKWANIIKKNNRLPQIFGGEKLKKPMVEEYMVANLEPWLDLSGVVDCYANNTIYEFKTGKTTSENYASSPQLGVYGILLTLSNKYADRAIVHHYDQHIKKHDMSIIWLTDKLLKNTHDWIIGNASEMHNYFEENQLYERFGGRR